MLDLLDVGAKSFQDLSQIRCELRCIPVHLKFVFGRFWQMGSIHSKSVTWLTWFEESQEFEERLPVMVKARMTLVFKHSSRNSSERVQELEVSKDDLIRNSSNWNLRTLHSSGLLRTPPDSGGLRTGASSAMAKTLRCFFFKP